MDFRPRYFYCVSDKSQPMTIGISPKLIPGADLRMVISMTIFETFEKMHHRKLWAAMASKYLSAPINQIMIIGKNGSVTADKSALCQHSTYFRDIFKEDSHTVTVNEEDISIELLLEVLRFTHSGYLKHLDTLAMDLLEVAERFKITEITTSLEKYLIDTLSHENVLDRIEKASDTPGLAKLQKAAIEYFTKEREVMEKGVGSGLEDSLSDNLKEILKGCI